MPESTSCQVDTYSKRNNFRGCVRLRDSIHLDWGASILLSGPGAGTDRCAPSALGCTTLRTGALGGAEPRTSCWGSACLRAVCRAACGSYLSASRRNPLRRRGSDIPFRRCGLGRIPAQSAACHACAGRFEFGPRPRFPRHYEHGASGVKAPGEVKAGENGERVG